MNKYLIKLANHLDKKGLHKEADYVDWIIKNASDNLSNPNNEDAIKLLKQKNPKAAEHLTNILKESDKLFLYRKGGLFKKGIYAKFAVNYRYPLNPDYRPGFRELIFDVNVDFVNKSGEKYKRRFLRDQNINTIDEEVKAFSDMRRTIQSPHSDISRGKIWTDSYYDRGMHTFSVRY